MRILLLNLGTPQGEQINRDVLYGAWCRGKRVGFVENPPLPTLYCYTILRNANYHVDFLEAMIQRMSYDTVLQSRDWNNYDLIATQSSTMTFRDDTALLKRIKHANPTIKTIVFGSHPTFMPDPALRNESVDYIIRYEPEETILKLVNALARKEPLENVKGIGFKKDGKRIVNPSADMADVEKLPIADRTLIKDFNYYHPLMKTNKWTNMETTRGCPAVCTFCTAPTFFGTNVRAMSITKVIDEMKYLISLGYEGVAFRDETFTYDQKRVAELCNRMIAENITLKWICNGRVGMINKDLMTLMKQAGCTLLLFGLESGDQQILNRIKKGTTVKGAIDAFKWAKEVDIETHAHFIFGHPGETEEQIKNTIAFAKEIDPTTIAFNINTLYPGSEQSEEYKHLLPQDWDGTEAQIKDLHVKSFQNYAICDVPPEKLEWYENYAYRAFYLRPKYVMKRLLHLTDPAEFMKLAKSGLGVLSLVMTKRN